MLQHRREYGENQSGDRQDPVTMRWSAGDSQEGNVTGMMQIGPVSRLLMDADEDTRRQVHAAVVEIMREFYDGDALNLPGATWMVTAHA